MPRVTYCIIEPGLEEAMIPFGLTSHEFFLMHVVELCQHIEFASLARCAAGEAKAAIPTTKVTERQMGESLQSLVARGLVQEVTEKALGEIRDILTRGGFTESDVLLGMPRVGGVDFTPPGANLYVAAYEALIDPDGPHCSEILDEETNNPILVSTGFWWVERMVYHFAIHTEGRHITKVEQAEYGGRLLFYWWHYHDCRKIRLTVERVKSWS